MSRGAMDYGRFEKGEGREPRGVFTIEIHTGIKENWGWDLLSEDATWKQAVEDAEFMKARNYKVRVRDGEGREYDV